MLVCFGWFALYISVWGLCLVCIGWFVLYISVRGLYLVCIGWFVLYISVWGLCWFVLGGLYCTFQFGVCILFVFCHMRMLEVYQGGVVRVLSWG